MTTIYKSDEGARAIRERYFGNPEALASLSSFP